MKATISIPGHHLLRDAKPGDLFVVHHMPYLAGCVLALARASATPCPSCQWAVIVATTDAVTSDWPRMGRVISLPEQTAITFVEQIERVAFRARRAPGSSALSPLEREQLEAQLRALRNEIEHPSPGAETPPATS